MRIINKIILIVLCLNTYGCLDHIIGPEPVHGEMIGYTNGECVDIETECTNIDSAPFTEAIFYTSEDSSEYDWLCFCEW